MQLINYCQQKGIQLVVLGDLFDYWMEYPHHVPSLGYQLLNRFEQYHQNFGPTLYITGNHDNWTRGHFTERGFCVINESFNITLSGQNLLLLHGDGLRDSQYNLKRPWMHQWLRKRFFIRWYQRILPPRLGIKVMKYFSRINRWIDRGDDQEKLNDWAEQQLKNSDIDLIISGHDHHPRRKHFASGCYINLGTYFRHRTMAYYNNSSFKIVSWKPVIQKLQPYDQPPLNE